MNPKPTPQNLHLRAKSPPKKKVRQEGAGDLEGHGGREDGAEDFLRGGWGVRGTFKGSFKALRDL